MKICDSTLRDGEQMPGVVFSYEQKLELARKFFEFGIDSIDLMPVVSGSEIKLAEALVNLGYSGRIDAATMLRRDHIELAKKIGLVNIILFTSVSDIHLEGKLGISRDENLKKSLENVDFANDLGLVVDFAGEDSTRADIDYLLRFMNKMEGKIRNFYPCDTMGVLTPRRTYDFIKRIKCGTACSLRLHIHNDFGLATASTLAGIEAGAESFSGTFCGIGERSGNAPMEEVVVGLKHLLGIELGLRYDQIGEICDLVSEYSGVVLQRHKPISGENAFSHESGIHVDGVLKNPLNYENISPESVGRRRRILYGKHSGTNSLKRLFGDRFNDREYHDILEDIKLRSEIERRSYNEKEVLDCYWDTYTKMLA